jgi:membrane protease YdiL (CAAX protease family)
MSIPPTEPLTHAPPEDAGRTPEESDLPPWPPWTAPAGVALGLTVLLFVDIFAGAFARKGSTSLTPAATLIVSILVDLGFVGVAVYLAAIHGGARPAYFGFRRVSPRLAVGSLITAAIGYGAVNVLYSQIVGIHGNEKLPKEFGVTNSTAALVGAAVFVCVIAPIAEELFFRGFIFGALRRWRIQVAGHDVGTWVAAVITAMLFGLAHGASAPGRYLVPLGFLGFVLCMLRWRTRSLYPGMALHSINNSLALGVGQEHWSALAIFGLAAGSLLLIGTVTGPLAARRPAPA